MFRINLVALPMAGCKAFDKLAATWCVSLMSCLVLYVQPHCTSPQKASSMCVASACCMQATLQSKDGLKGIIQESLQDVTHAAMQVVQSGQDDGPASETEAAEVAADESLKRKVSRQEIASGPASGAAANGEDSSAASAKRQKKQKDIAKPKVGYSRDEAETFCKEIHAISKDESRLKCAADDVLGCLNHIFTNEFSPQDQATSRTAIMRTKSLCLSLWSEFLLAGEVSLNGKQIKAWSALRPELQFLARMAKEKISMAGNEKDPLALARELTEELIEAPVQLVVEGEDDGHTRILDFLKRQGQEVQQIKVMVEETLDLPLTMHEPVISSLRMAVGKRLHVIDFLTNVFDHVENAIPARWLSFATDVSDYFAATSGGFAAGSQEAGAVGARVCCEGVYCLSCV